ncbi:MAG: VWA domain-containing protein [Gammaproteobacteria bacterium]|nr:MAG: VWA domain-containing protein [Gammaproteobacteria bacterium]
MFELQWPWLLALIPLPLLIILLPAQKKEEAALRVPFFAQVKTLETKTHSLGSQKRAGALLLWLIWMCLVLAAANPQWIGEPVSMPNSGRDLLIAVDISGSMKIDDMKYQGNPIRRLEAVKMVVGDFVKNRKSDRLGLVLFGTQAYLQAPLTYDRQTVNTLLQETEIGFAGDQTSIGDAIGLAIKRLRARPDAQRVLIVLTDGANTAGELEPIKAAELAEKEHVKIYTIGFGADEMLVDNGFFGSRVINPSADLDEPTMRAIADKTGGQYFRARNLEELGDVHQMLNRLEPIETEDEKFRPVNSLFYYPLITALLLSFLWSLIRILRSSAADQKTRGVAS